MITIRDVDSNNVCDVCELTTNANGVGTTMEEWLCCNATSLAESKYFPEMHPRALYDDETLVGFIMYRPTDEEPETAAICRFMIDHKFQGTGLGREALSCMLATLKQQGVRTAVIMVDDENTVAKTLYTSLGFTFTGKIDKGEHYYELAL